LRGKFIDGFSFGSILDIIMVGVGVVGLMWKLMSTNGILKPIFLWKERKLEKFVFIFYIKRKLLYNGRRKVEENFTVKRRVVVEKVTNIGEDN